MSYFKTGQGFSIELIDWHLEYRGTHEGLPLYESLGGKITNIAIVDFPAIKKNAVGDSDDKTLTGPVMIPDQKIFRTTGPKGKENCYWYFSAQTISELQKTFKGKVKIGH